jgi:cell fate regulator YaaT (PSP1 superfamily)
MARVGLDRIVGVRLTPSGPVQYYDSQGIQLRTGDRVEVEAEEGLETGRVVIAPGQALHSDLGESLKLVLRMAPPAS